MCSLIAELARVIMEPASKRKLLGKPYLTCWRYLGCYEQAFESGAVLGHAFSARLPTLVQLFCEIGREQELSGALREAAKNHLTQTGEPKSFIDMAMWFEKTRAEDVWRKAGATESDIEHLVDTYELPLSDAFPRLQFALSTGIGFGATYPERTAEMWRRAYEIPKDQAELKMMRQAGLYLDASAEKPLPLKVQQGKLLSFVRLFVAKARPELAHEFRNFNSPDAGAKV